MRLTSGYGPGRPEIWHAADVPLEERRREHGSGAIEMPDVLTAGEFSTVGVEFRIGRLEVPEGGQIAVAWRWPFDWSDLQADDPSGAGYVTFSAKNAGGQDADVELAASYNPYGGIEPYHHYLALTVERGTLREGDVVSITCGDRSAGGPGWRAPTCAARAVGFLLLVDPKGQQRWTELPRPAPYRIAPGDARRLVAVALSDAVAGKPLPLVVRAEDEWGNATQPNGGWKVSATEAPGDSPLEVQNTTVLDSPPACHLSVTLNEPGVQRLQVALPDLGLSAESNPIVVHAAEPLQRVWWGDLHSGQSLIGCGAGTLAENYAYGRDAAGLQFITHQANDHYVTTDDWLETRERTVAFNEPGRYVVILGCEWSPYTPQGGDRNVFYNYDEPRIRRSARFFTESEPDNEPDLPTAPEFHAVFRDLDVLVNMHVGGRMTNLEWHEPRIEKLAEIHSTHGTVEWFFRDCLRRGYRVAVTAGTDGVMGRPGACHPGSRLIRNVTNGLTAILAPELTRDALWKALHARRTYATTGARILLDVAVDGHPMGDEYETTGSPQIKIHAEGTAAIESVELMRGLETIHSWQIAPPREPAEGVLRVLWGGTEQQGTARKQRVLWDGSLEVDGGQIEIVAPVAFQSPLDTIENASPQRIEWKSITAGNDMGVLVRIDADDDVCKFTSGPSTFEFRLGDVREATKTVDAGGVNRRITIGPAPADDGDRRIDLEYTDASPWSDSAPYWVRVIQVDRHKAWSTPVYVTRPES